MNILFVSHGLYPCEIGGTEIFNYHLMKELSVSHNIFVITCCRKELPFKARIIGVNPRRFLLRRFSIPLQDFINIARLRNKIDFFHISYKRANWLYWLPYPLIRRIFGIPYVISIRGGGMYKWRPGFPHRFLFNNAARIVGVSEKLKEEYGKRSAREIEFIPSSLPFTESRVKKEELRQKYGYKASDNILLYVGSLKKIKGCDALLEAFINIGRDFVDRRRLRLCFVGDGEMRPDLEKKSKEGNVSRCVDFKGRVAREEVSHFYKMADFYVIPSLFEGKSNSLLEAMFNKMPIIASDARGINDTIVDGKNGLLFETGNARDLSCKITYLMENTDIIRRISEGARETFDNNYTFDTVVSRYLEVYKGILQGKA